MSRCSGGTLCRPVRAYIASNSGASSVSSASTTGLIRRIGWSTGIRLSVVRVDSIVAWREVVPRMLNLRKLNGLPKSRIPESPCRGHP
ncbi:MAG TPA: hypothetical protein VIJ58_00795 [Candidatus Dormibacteraeota bacterium]